MSSTRRTVAILDLLARRGPLGVRAVAQQLKLPLGSVHRILLDLAEESVVERTADGDWDLSHRLFEITGRQLDRIQLAAAGAALRRADRGGDARDCERLPPQRRGGVCIDKVRGNEAMQLDAPDRLARAALLRRRRQGDARLHERCRAGAHASRRRSSRSRPTRSPTPKRFAASSSAFAERGYSIDNEEVVDRRSLRRHADPRPERRTRRGDQHHRAVAEGARPETRAAARRCSCRPAATSAASSAIPAHGLRSNRRSPRRRGGRPDEGSEERDDARRVGDEAEAGQRGDLQAEARRDLAGAGRADEAARASATTRSTATASPSSPISSATRRRPPASRMTRSRSAGGR